MSCQTRQSQYPSAAPPGWRVRHAVGRGLPRNARGLRTAASAPLWPPTGKLLAKLLTGQHTSNCAWGDDGSTLYITADMFVVRIKTKTKGAGW